jgi:glutamate/tyrosine decarboxylase-like PLP-dependent enzyme
VAALTGLNEPLPDGPCNPSETIERLDRYGSPATMAMAGPRFFGFVIGGSMPVTLAANWLAGAWDQNTAFLSATPATSTLERIALEWLVDLLGLPPGSGGAFVTGATLANFTALGAARHAVLKRVGWNVEADGLIGAPPITVIVGEEAHPTLFKSLGLLGLGRSRVVKVPVDGQGRMRPEALPEIAGPTIVCIQFGNINTGAFDPISAIADRIAGSGAWLHVDGAFGLWAAAAPALRHLASGIERADSWATDAHKWLNVPYDCALAIVADPARLTAALGLQAAYVPASAARDALNLVPEFSRRARALPVYAALRALGRRGLAAQVDRCCALARRAAAGLADGGTAEVLNDVTLNQVLFRVPGVSEDDVIQQVQRDGTCWLGGTAWQGAKAIRFSVSGWSTTEADIDRSVAAIRAAIEARRTGVCPPDQPNSGAGQVILGQ